MVSTVLKKAKFFYFIDVFTAAELLHRFLFVFLQSELVFQVSAAPKMRHKEPSSCNIKDVAPPPPAVTLQIRNHFTKVYLSKKIIKNNDLKN